MTGVGAKARRSKVRCALSLGTLLIALALLALPAAAQALSYSATVLADNPAGYWRLGETSGTLMADSSPNHNDGQYLNGVVLGAPGAIAGDANTAATFDGVNDIGRVPDSSSLDVGSTFTAEGWIRRTSTSKTTTLMNKGDNGLQLVVMNAGSGSQVWLRKTNVTTIARSSGGVPADGRFHHVVATMNGPGSTARIYIDGVDQTVVVSATQSIANTNFPLVFGGAGSDPANFDELALYGRALSGAEVAEHYQAATSLTITKTGPLAVFPDQEFDYAISVKNNGTSTVTGVEVVDTLPATGAFVSSTPAGTPVSPGPGATYTIAVGSVGPGATVDVTVRWRAPSSGGVVTNSAIARASSGPPTAPASASVSVGVSTVCNPCGVDSAGTGLRNRDHGSVTIDEIPAGATVARAVLVWAVLFDEDDGAPADTITFEGNEVSADLTSSVSGDLCWDDDGTIGYAADVTPYVTGNGTFEITDPPLGSLFLDDDPGGTLPFTDGASLVVFYTGGGADAQVLSDFSYDTDTDADDGITRSFGAINSVGGPASLILAGPDGQGDYGDVFTFTGSSTTTVYDSWDGSSPQDGPSFDIGNLWDDDRHDVTGVLPAGQSTFVFDHGHDQDDCIGVGAAVLSVSQTPPA